MNHTVMSSEQPIFVCGVPKSGTTLVGQLLSNHPDITIDYDIDPTVHFLKYVESAQASNLFLEEKPEGWESLNIEYFQKLHHSYQSGAKRWGSSTCLVHLYRHRVWEWFPLAQFVAVLRDPRDHWCSFKHLYIPNRDDRWEHFMRCHRGLPKPGEDSRMKFVEYHEVIKNPTVVFDALGLKTPKDYLDGVLEVFLSRTLGDHTKEWMIELRKGSKIITSRVGRWKRELNEDEVQRCIEAFPEACEYYDSTVY